jgi:type VI secretion system protein ImpA
VSASDVSAAVELDDGGVPVRPEHSPGAPPLAEVSGTTPAASVSLSAPRQTEGTSETAPPLAGSPASPAPTLDPAVAALCVPLSEADPCGPDLDLEGDGPYLNYLAAAEGVLPTSFFDVLDGGKPFDRASIDLPGLIEAIKPLLERTRDLRLLIMRARLLILNRDLGGFAVTVAAIAEWLERFWEAVHPRPEGRDLNARITTLGALDLPTVVFPLQYAPLFEARRIGAVTYRALMIATEEVKPRTGEQKRATSDLTEAMADADPAALAASRKHIAMLKDSLGRIRNALLLRGGSCGLESLPALVEKISAFVDPLAARDQGASDAEADAADTDPSRTDATKSAGPAPASLSQARHALAAIADYYSRLEPSSPTLPLVRQAHDLIGKSFFEVMSILVPTQMEKAAFQIGAEQIFELPVGRLPKLSESKPEAVKQSGADGTGQPADALSPGGAGPAGYSVQSRSQAIALLDQVQRFFRAAEPSSPVPMLCERARALAERDFMAVLRDVLPKAAFKNPGADK